MFGFRAGFCIAASAELDAVCIATPAAIALERKLRRSILLLPATLLITTLPV